MKEHSNYCDSPTLTLLIYFSKEPIFRTHQVLNDRPNYSVMFSLFRLNLQVNRPTRVHLKLALPNFEQRNQTRLRWGWFVSLIGWGSCTNSLYQAFNQLGRIARRFVPITIYIVHWLSNSCIQFMRLLCDKSSIHSCFKKERYILLDWCYWYIAFYRNVAVLNSRLLIRLIVAVKRFKTDKTCPFTHISDVYMCSVWTGQ